MKNILIIRLSSIGDIVLTSPIVRVLKNSYTNTKLSFLTFEHFKETILYNQRIDDKIFIPKNAIKSDFANYFENNLKEYSNTQFDAIIDLQNNHYSRKILSYFKYDKIFKLNKQRLHKLSLVYLKIPLIKNFNVIENYFLSFNEEFQVYNDGLGLEFWFDNETLYPNQRQKNKNTNIAISIAPGAAHATKQWLPSHFVKLINLLTAKFLDKIQIQLLGSSKEIASANYIDKEIKAELKNFVSKTNLVETAKLIDQSDLFITNDTGLMHIAVARQVPTIAIFGSSVKELGFAHDRDNFRILEEKLWCRPCSHIGRKQCPLYHFNCMKNIKPHRVFEACLEMLNQQ